MADIRIHREHQLGLAKARKVAWQWAEQVEEKFDMECTVIEGETSDTVEFTRSGVNGTLIVAADHFDLDAKLGFLLGAFSKHDRRRDREEPRRAAGQAQGAAKKAAGEEGEEVAALLQRLDQVDVVLHRVVRWPCP